MVECFWKPKMHLDIFREAWFEDHLCQISSLGYPESINWHRNHFCWETYQHLQGKRLFLLIAASPRGQITPISSTSLGRSLESIYQVWHQHIEVLRYALTSCLPTLSPFSIDCKGRPHLSIPWDLPRYKIHTIITFLRQNINSYWAKHFYLLRCPPVVKWLSCTSSGRGTESMYQARCWYIKVLLYFLFGDFAAIFDWLWRTENEKSIW